MATYQISARRGNGLTRTFSLDCASRQEAESTVRSLGWEPDPDAAPAPRTLGAVSSTSASGSLLDGVGRSKLVVIGGLLGVIGGTWLPVLSVSAMGQSQGFSLWDGSALWPGSCIAAAVAAGVLGTMGSWKTVIKIAAAIGGALLLRMILLWSDLSDASRMMGGMAGSSGEEQAFGQAMAQAMGFSITLGYGWLVLFASVAAILYGAFKTSLEEGG